MEGKESASRAPRVKLQTVGSFSEAADMQTKRTRPTVITGLSIEGSWAKEAREAKQRRESKQNS